MLKQIRPNKPKYKLRKKSKAKRVKQIQLNKNIRQQFLNNILNKKVIRQLSSLKR